MRATDVLGCVNDCLVRLESSQFPIGVCYLFVPGGMVGDKLKTDRKGQTDR